MTASCWLADDSYDHKYGPREEKVLVLHDTVVAGGHWYLLNVPN